MKALFLRRRGLGLNSLRGITAFMNDPEFKGDCRRFDKVQEYGDVAGYTRHDAPYQGPPPKDVDFLIRWGCTAESGFAREKQLNPSAAIQTVNNKKRFREILVREAPLTIPATYFNWREVPEGQRVIIRPSFHAQGRRLYTATGPRETRRVVEQKGLADYYVTALVDKVQEFRVYVVEGRVANVAQKIPEDKNAIAWNHAKGAVFENVRWDDWHPAVIGVALEAFKHSTLDFGGVDVMLDREGDAWVLEINSAPSLPLNEDGSVSYRGRCMGNAFNWILVNGRGNVEPVQRIDGWRSVIHPGVWRKDNGKAVKGLAA